MQRYLTFFVVAMFLTSCAGFQKQETLAEVKAGLVCLEYTEGIAWKQIADNFGDPDIAPFPAPGTSLQSNARGYKDTIVILSTENREIKEGNKTRFREVVTAIELCKKK